MSDPRVAEVDPGFANWLAGFIDGEGCFTIPIRKGSPRCGFSIRVRDDDAAIIEEIHKRTGIGFVSRTRAYGKANPQIGWFVANKPDCLALCELLERYPLRAKKSRDFRIWAEAVEHWQSLRSGRRCGERHRGNKLTRQSVAEIHRLREAGKTYTAIAAIYDVDPSTVSSVVRGLSWQRDSRDPAREAMWRLKEQLQEGRKYQTTTRRGTP